DALALTPYIARILVVADAQEDRLPQFSVRRPLGELRFDDDLRRNPVGAFTRPHLFGKWRRLAFDRREPAVHVAQRLAVEAAAHAPRIVKLSGRVEVAEQ